MSRSIFNRKKYFVFFRSSVGPEYARNRAIVYCILGMVFLGAGIGVTVSRFCGRKVKMGHKQVKVDNDQKMAQSERNSHSKNGGEKKN